MLVLVRYHFLDSGEDGEHNGAGIVEISKVYVMQDAGFFGSKSFDSV